MKKILTLFGSIATICSCTLSTQLTSNKHTQVLNESYTWDVDVKNLTYWPEVQTEIAGKVEVELYKNSAHKGIKIANGANAKLKNFDLKDILHTEYDGDVRIETIGSRAFEANKSIEGNISIMDVVNIDEHGFSKTNIDFLIISSKLKYVNEYAFCDCMNLKDIIVGQATKEVPIVREGAFNNCPNLEKIEVWQTVIPSLDIYKEWKVFADAASKQVGHEVELIMHYW